MFYFDIKQKSMRQYQRQNQPSEKVIKCIYGEQIAPVTGNDLYDHLADALSKAP